MTYEDESGEPPCAEDLVVHLDLVRRAVEVHAAMVSHEGPEGGPLPRMGDPPLWLASLWLPAASVVAVAGDRWPWSFAVLPVALAAPLLWRLRIRRA